MGGWTSESEVSMTSGQAAYEALLRLGYRAQKIIFSRNIAEDLREIKPDIVFNALHGKYGEDGRIQGLLDILGIPYTHSGLEASAICMDKALTAKICCAYGVKMPRMEILTKGGAENQALINKIGKPFVIKPLDDGSSFGVEVILEGDEFDIENYGWEFGDKMMIEEYIKGQELQVAIINDKALGVLEVRPKKLFYDYECKYSPGMTDYIMPAEISSQKYEEALAISQKIHNLLGCKGISRVEMILCEKSQEFYFLELNTHPGFTPLSVVPKIAKHVGIDFDEIVQYLISEAQCKN